MAAAESGGAVGLKAPSANRRGRPGREEIRGRFPTQGPPPKASDPHALTYLVTLMRAREASTAIGLRRSYGVAR
jgi:hypothetical protein